MNFGSLIFKTMMRSNNLSLKYRRFTPSGCEDKVKRKFELVAKTKFLTK